MEISKQVCSFSLAKQLKKLGVPQKSHWKWCENNPKKIQQADSSRLEIDLTWSPAHSYLKTKDSIYAAFSVAELGEIISETGYKMTGRNSTFMLSAMRLLSGTWIIKAFCKETYIKAKTEANVRAQFLLSLIKSQKLTF